VGWILQSRNKPKPTAAEKRHIERLAQLPCVVCGADGVEIHEPEQGLWFVAMPLCPTCHRDPKYGWHGQRLNWKAVKYGELDAINATIRMLESK
jgi:hypothetical protein